MPVPPHEVAHWGAWPHLSQELVLGLLEHPAALLNGQPRPRTVGTAAPQRYHAWARFSTAYPNQCTCCSLFAHTYLWRLRPTRAILACCESGLVPRRTRP